MTLTLSGRHAAPHISVGDCPAACWRPPPARSGRPDAPEAHVVRGQCIGTAVRVRCGRPECLTRVRHALPPPGPCRWPAGTPARHRVGLRVTILHPAGRHAPVYFGINGACRRRVTLSGPPAAPPAARWRRPGVWVCVGTAIVILTVAVAILPPSVTDMMADHSLVDCDILRPAAEEAFMSVSPHYAGLHSDDELMYYFGVLDTYTKNC